MPSDFANANWSKFQAFDARGIDVLQTHPLARDRLGVLHACETDFTRTAAQVAREHAHSFQRGHAALLDLKKNMIPRSRRGIDRHFFDEKILRPLAKRPLPSAPGRAERGPTAGPGFQVRRGTYRFVRVFQARQFSQFARAKIAWRPADDWFFLGLCALRAEHAVDLEHRAIGSCANDAPGGVGVVVVRAILRIEANVCRHRIGIGRNASFAQSDLV